MSAKKTTNLRRKPVYTWHDWFVGVYFLIMASSSFITIRGDSRLFIYSISAAIIGIIGLVAVIGRLRRVEGIMLITFGFLLMARALLLLPVSMVAGNTSPIDYLADIVHNRPLLDGMVAIFPLAVLAAYRGRRGKLQK